MKTNLLKQLRKEARKAFKWKVIEIAPKRYVFKKRGFLTEYHTSVWQPFSSVEHEEITGPGYTKETLEYKYRQWEHEFIQKKLLREYKPEHKLEDIINA